MAGEPGPLGEIDALVELAGSVTEPRRWAEEALGSGLPYVTANKALLAAHGGELAELAMLNDAALMASASVGGGTPMLEVTEHLAASGRVSRLRGLLNATTTFILSGMAEGRSYREALAEAQAAGYAEADPSFDVEGRDAAQKLAILAWVAWGRGGPRRDVDTHGHPEHPGPARRHGPPVAEAGPGVLRVGPHRARAERPVGRACPASNARSRSTATWRSAHRPRPGSRRAGHRRRGVRRPRPSGARRAPDHRPAHPTEQPVHA